MLSKPSSYYNNLENVDSKDVYNQLPEYTRISRYSQYNPTKKRRETWFEQTERVFKMHKVKFAEFVEDETFMEAFEFAKDMVNKKHVLGSQRALQFGGPAILNKNSRIYNCFSADTKFWTENGVKAFNQFEDGDDVVIRGKDKWMPAKVEKFGNEELFKLKVQKKNTIVDIFTTLNHRWIAKENNQTPFCIKTTEELNAGDILQEMSKRTNITQFQMCPIGIQHGIVYGDGTYNKQLNNCQIKLCGYKTELSKHFFSERKDQETITGLPKNWKELPSLDMNKEYLYGFLSGWFATDGTVDKCGRITIANSNKQTLEWLKTAFFKLDIMTGIISISRETSPFDNSFKSLFRVNIVKKNIPKNFYINSKHLERYKPSVENSNWKVVSIETTDRKEDVWCVVEPEKEEFTLESGILTKNCAATYIDRQRVFQEIMFTLLCGVGIGFSVQKHHIEKLPSLVKPNEEAIVTYDIADSIEGWSDSVGVLMESYFINNESETSNSYFGKTVKFNYSLIRPKGSPISHMGGKAPGPDGLKNSLENVRKILDKCVRKKETHKLRSIQCYDILMHISDAVLSGGIRRCIGKGSLVLTRDGSYKPIENIQKGDFVSTNDGWKMVTDTFSQGEQKTIKIIHSEGRLICTSNHRIAVLKDIHGNFEWKEAGKLVSTDKLLYVEPDLYENGVNVLPEFKYDFPLHSTTCKNITLPELDEEIAWLLGNIQGDGYVYLSSKAGSVSIAVEPDNMEQVEFVQQQLQRFGVNTTLIGPKPSDRCTKITTKSKQLATYLYSWLKQPKTCLKVPDCVLNGTREIKFSYIQGLMDADGCIKGRSLQIMTSVYPKFVNEIQNLLYSLGIVSRFKKCSLCGLKDNWKPKYSLSILLNSDRKKFNNGCSFGWKKFPMTCATRYGNSVDMSMFNTLDIRPKNWHKQIARNAKKIHMDIWKNFENNVYIPIDIKSIEEYKSVETYDIEVDGNHNFICEGVLVHNSATLCLFSLDDEEMINAKTGDWYIKNPQRARSNNSALLLRDQIPEEKYMKLIESVKQFGEPGLIFADNTETLYNPCVEISLYGYDEKGNSGTQFCNLSEINMGNVQSEEDFYERCRAAAILGTFQAAYTDFGYLGDVTRAIVEREALIGVSMTGMMETPLISFSPEILSKGAKIVKDTNEYIANIIGINQAARTTCVKPAGSTSCILGTSSGIHPCHAKRYFRRVQSNTTEEPLAFFKKFNSHAVNKSVWSAGGTDDVITFLCKSKENSLTKDDVSAIDLLQKVKLVQTYWVTEGRNIHKCVQPWLNHNVSNTITIKPDEWDSASKYIYENRSYFAGISMLGDSGDMTYQQAPFQAVFSQDEIASKYGAGSVFASGLIVHAHIAFDNNLYSACACLLGYGEKLKMPEFDVNNSVSFTESDNIYKKIRWIAQAKKFSLRHFENDLERMCNCLKAVDAWKTWCDLKRTYKHVPWEEFLEENDNTKRKDYVACSGGKCELISF
jgi:intein/homing endonuclease